MADFKMEGFRELGEALDEMSKATARNTINRALTKAAKPVETAMRAKAPKLTGQLTGSIRTGKKLTSRQARDAKKDGKAFAEIHVGTSDPAAIPQEFGTFKEPAQPFGRPAWESTQGAALADIKHELSDEIEKTRARAARKVAKLAGL